MVSGIYLFFKLSNLTEQGMREQIMGNDMGLNRGGLRVTNTAEERESHEKKRGQNKGGWMIHSLLGYCFVCGRTHSNSQTFIPNSAP